MPQDHGSSLPGSMVPSTAVSVSNNGKHPPSKVGFEARSTEALTAMTIVPLSAGTADPSNEEVTWTVWLKHTFSVDGMSANATIGSSAAPKRRVS